MDPSKSYINNKIRTFHIDASRKMYNTMYYMMFWDWAFFTFAL